MLRAIPGRAQRTSGVLAGVLVGLVLLGAFLGGPGTAGAASVWLANVDLTARDGNASSPAVAMNAQGDVAVAWVDGAVFARLRPTGGQFGPAVQLSASGSGTGGPQVAMADSGETLVAWGRSGPAAGVWVAIKPPGGAFSGPVDISGRGESPSSVGLAANPRGDAVIVWDVPDSSSNPPRSLVRAATRPAGGSFGKPATLDTGNATAPLAAVDDAGGATAVWSSETGIQVSLLPPGATFGPRIPLSNDVASPALAMNPAGAALVAWRGPSASPPGSPTVKFATRAGGHDQRFGPTMEVSDTRWPAGIAAALDATGETRLVWTDNDMLLRGASTPPGGPPGPTVELFESSNDDLNWMPRMGVSRDGTAIALTGGQTASDDLDHATAVVWPAGQAPAPPRSVCTARMLDFASPALDAHGNGIVVCNTANYLQYAAYDASGPQLRGLAVPDSATAGRPVDFSVAPVDVWSGVAHVVWDFDDGHQAVGTTAQNTFTAPGTYTVTTTATDGIGNPTSTRRLVTVKRAPPPPPPPSSVCIRARDRLASARSRYRRALTAFHRHRTRRRLAVVNRTQRDAAAARRAVHRYCPS